MPIRLDAIPVRNPAFVSRLSFSFTFASADGYAYPETAFFSVEWGVLYFRRSIESLSTIKEFSRTP